MVSAMPDEGPARAVAASLLEVAPQLIRLLSSTLDSRPGLTLRQFRILQQLYDGVFRARDLATSTGVTAPTMSAALADLEGRGLIARTSDPVDGRANLVVITDSGRAAVRETRELLLAVLEGVATGVDDADAESTERLSRILLRGLSRAQPGVAAKP
ncbi:MAG: hypothetical protein QOE19_3461 [Actinomycetota bacterium]|jgi:DNA-binding MarR family transcriptional regulator|nr:hypothetical protein [Actinomycetota bacterium]MDQ1668924.1 hypothetical protein [Actinomycetota bacterium]